MNEQDGSTSRLPVLVMALLLALLLLVLAACGPAVRRRASNVCAYRRVAVAYDLYDQAKGQLTRHYQVRTDTALGRSYQHSRDSVLLARASRGCTDFDEIVRRQAIDLIRANLLLQRLLVSNMRDQDPSVVIDLYGEEYREIFKNDIQ